MIKMSQTRGCRSCIKRKENIYEKQISEDFLTDHSKENNHPEPHCDDPDGHQLW